MDYGDAIQAFGFLPLQRGPHRRVDYWTTSRIGRLEIYATDDGYAALKIGRVDGRTLSEHVDCHISLVKIPLVEERIPLNQWRRQVEKANREFSEYLQLRRNEDLVVWSTESKACTNFRADLTVFSLHVHQPLTRLLTQLEEQIGSVQPNRVRRGVSPPGPVFHISVYSL